MTQELSEEEYIKAVGLIAKNYGYTVKQIWMFLGDIKDCYEEGLSVEECVNNVF